MFAITSETRVGDGAPGKFTGDPVTLALGSVTEPSLASFDHQHVAAGWVIEAVEDLASRDLLFVGHELLGLVMIHVLDIETGEWVGRVLPEAYVGTDAEPELLAGGSPLMIHDRDAPRLIISDTFYEPPYGGQMETQYRVLVFDIANGLALESETILPGGRIGGFQSGRWAPHEEGHLTGSRDDRFLYFVERWEDRSLLRSGHRVGIIDRDDAARIVAATDLPQRCGRDRRPSLFPGSGSSVIATCPDSGHILEIAPDGSLLAEVEAGGIIGMWRDASFSEWAEGLLGGIDTPRGIAALFFDGSFARVSGTDVTVIANALRPRYLATGTWRSEHLSLDAARLIIPYRPELSIPDGATQEELSAIFNAPDSGFAIFNTDTAAVERDVRVDHHARYPIGDDRIVLVNEERIDVLDLRTMSIQRSFNTTPPALPARMGPDAPYGPIPLVR